LLEWYATLASLFGGSVSIHLARVAEHSFVCGDTYLTNDQEPDFLLGVAPRGWLQPLKVKASPVEHTLDCEIGRDARPPAVLREGVAHRLKAEEADCVDHLLRRRTPAPHKVEVGLADHPGGEEEVDPWGTGMEPG
jgi:hypothetical protein